MSEDTTGCTNGDQFVSIGECLSEKQIKCAVIATAIEKEEVYTWDRFDRFIPATEGSSDDSTSKAYILDLLAEYYRLTTAPQRSYEDDEALFALENDDWSNPLRCFGWRSGDKPNFDSLLKESEQLNAPRKPRNELAPQRAVARLIKGLIVLNYGEDMIEELNKERTEEITTIKLDLQLKEFHFDAKTLRKYLKHLPD